MTPVYATYSKARRMTIAIVPLAIAMGLFVLWFYLARKYWWRPMVRQAQSRLHAESNKKPPSEKKDT